MAVPKTTQTRYMDGSVQATQMTTQVTHPYIIFHFCYPPKTVSSTMYVSVFVEKGLGPSKLRR